jgi:hypothetical protein
MSKRLILVLALAFVVGIAFAAYAEVQNVKVSGDITVYGIYRDNYSTTNSGGGKTPTSTVGTKTSSRDSLMSIIRLRVDADLTDNVAATVRLINERDWDVDSAATNDIDLDLAYVTLKEFLYSPMTLKVGRQDLRIGSGLVIGDGVLTDTSGEAATVLSSILEDDLSARKAFDAIVATLDYDPLILNLAIAKLDEGINKTTDEDSDAYILDAIYKFNDKMKTVADLSYIVAHDNSTTPATPTKGLNTHIIDLRLTMAEILKNLSGELEYAREFGDYAAGRSNAGWALTAGANYAFAGVKYSPTLGLKYDYRSGDKLQSGATSTTGKWKAWRVLYEDQVNGVIFDPNTNISIIKVSGSMKPMEDIILAADYYNYRYAQKVAVSAPNKGEKKGAGDELDLSLTYNYTEDVSFGLLGGMFWPGSDFTKGQDNTATEILGSMKVTF